MHFPKKSGHLSSAGPEILVFVSHCSANFQPILNCFETNFKLKYEDSENIKADRVNAVVFNLNQTSSVFWDTRYMNPEYIRQSLTHRRDTISRLKEYHEYTVKHIRGI